MTTTSPDTLTLDDPRLKDFFVNSYKPRAQWGMGLEYEVSGIRRDDLSPVPFFGERSIEVIMERFRQMYPDAGTTWEDGFCFGIKAKHGNITLEPGGQVEFSCAPFQTIEEIRAAFQLFLENLHTLSKELDLVFYTAGVNPFHAREMMPWSPKYRYKIMRKYLGEKGKYAHYMMQQTMSLQYNIDFSDEQDALRKYEAARRLQPLLLWLSSNSYIYNQTPLDAPFRAEIWENMDDDRSGLPPAINSIADYIDYALDVPMFFFQRGEEWLSVEDGTTFRKFLKRGCQGHRATYQDWELHLSTLFPEVRFKKNALELRMFDGNQPKIAMAFLALVQALFYNDEALDQVLEREWPVTWEDAETLLAKTESFLPESERSFLAPLRTVVHTKQHPGQREVLLFEGEERAPRALLNQLQLPIKI